MSKAKDETCVSKALSFYIRDKKRVFVIESFLRGREMFVITL